MISDRVIDCRKTVRSFAIAISGVGAVPVPFSDFFIMTPLQCIMVMVLARKYERNITFNTAGELVAAITGGFLGKKLCSALIKFIPIVGRMITIPFAYCWTFALGEMAILYFEKNCNISPENLRDGFEKAKENAEKDYVNRKISPDDAMEILNKYLTEEEYKDIKERLKKGKNKL